MKRSEMIRLIKDELSYELDDDSINTYDLAEKVLARVEESGMLPPTTEIKMKNQIGKEEFYRDNCWDKEN